MITGNPGSIPHGNPIRNPGSIPCVNPIRNPGSIPCVNPIIAGEPDVNFQMKCAKLGKSMKIGTDML